MTCDRHFDLYSSWLSGLRDRSPPGSGEVTASDAPDQTAAISVRWSSGLAVDCCRIPPLVSQPIGAGS